MKQSSGESNYHSHYLQLTTSTDTYSRASEKLQGAVTSPLSTSSVEDMRGHQHQKQQQQQESDDEYVNVPRYTEEMQPSWMIRSYQYNSQQQQHQQHQRQQGSSNNSQRSTMSSSISSKQIQKESPNTSSEAAKKIQASLR